jgi:cytochrome c oxidase assembly factor CtaG
VNFWCTTTKAPWDWSWRAYPGVWLLVVALAVPYIVAIRRRQAQNGTVAGDGKRAVQFLCGVAVLWLSFDWPLGLLGAGYLATAHMLMFMLVTQVAAPLMLLGTPEWMFRRITSRLRITRATRWLAKPVRAGLVFNAILLGTQVPFVVDAMRPIAATSFLLDMVWLVGGFVLWIPLLAPAPELRTASFPGRIVYLFLAAGALPLIPGGFLTFSDIALYRIYELAPRVWSGFDAVSDQQVAGAVMKVGSLPIIWPVILALFLQWASRERGTNERAARPAAPPAPA